MIKMKKIVLLASSLILTSTAYATQYTYSVTFDNQLNATIDILDGAKKVGDVKTNSKQTFTFKNAGDSINVKINGKPYCQGFPGSPMSNPFNLTNVLEWGSTSFTATLMGYVKPGNTQVNCNVMPN